MSQNWQKNVRDFHDKFGCARSDKPIAVSPAVRQLRMEVIGEEVNRELFPAMEREDLPAIADALADSMYVILGTAVSYGIDLQPVWEMVHTSNMAKEGGGTRADGKILKPPGWQPPDIAAEIRRQQS